ncbi:MAG: Rne/Rng family ribonuclease [Pseudomonadota bacterium]|nr:Rne/Rng family ribonuclease [Pseudomonadota bacterium]
MTKRMLIDATQSEETRVVLTGGNRVEDFDFEVSKRRPLKGNIYLAQVTRVEPSLQAAFIEYGGNRHGFLAFNEIHPDYYRIPMEDREALLAEQAIDLESSLPSELNESDDDEDTQSSQEENNLDQAATSSENNSSESFRENEDATDETGDAISKTEDVSNGLLETNVDASTSGRENTNGPVTRKPKRYKIQEVIARRQIMLIQVVKEERGNNGAALTTYLSLAGRYCVLMPNTPRGGGVSRKIISPLDRKRLKNVVEGLNLPDGMAAIVRTAGSERTKTEIKRDYEYLIRLWDQIRESTLVSTAPYLVHEEANLIKRSIRDLYTRDIDEILIEGEEGYKLAKSFMKTLMPSHAKRVQRFSSGGVPIFNKFKIETQLDYLYEPTVQLKSGGYIVLNQTEALVAVDVNSGRSTKERNIEETALKTNLEAAEEIARQLRLRDLAGLVVIDFIDMYENKNQHAIERKMRDVVKSDRARIQMSRISQFGLMELSRQRLRPSVMEASTQQCPHCAGSGVQRSIESAALQVLRNLEEEGISQQAAQVTVFVPTEIGFYLLNRKRDVLNEMEERYEFKILLNPDDKLILPEHRIERTANKAKDKQLKEIVELSEETKTEQDSPSDKKDSSSTGKRSNNNRTRRRHNNQPPKNATRDVNDTQSVKNKQPSYSEEDQGSDDNDTSKKKKRRGKRGGKRRTKKDIDEGSRNLNKHGTSVPSGDNQISKGDESFGSETMNDSIPKASQHPDTEINTETGKAKPPKKRRSRVKTAAPKQKTPKTRDKEPAADEQTLKKVEKPAKAKPKSSKVVRIKNQDGTIEKETTKSSSKASPRQGWWSRDTE